MWNFEKLPADEHTKVVELYNSGQWFELLKIHNRYRLSENTYCCQVPTAMNRWFTYGISQKLIIHEQEQGGQK